MRYPLSKLLITLVFFLFAIGAQSLRSNSAYAEKQTATDLKGIAENNAALMPERKKVTNDPWLHEVERVGLYLVVPQTYLTVYQCHDRELECAKENGGLGGFPEKRDQYVRELKETYSKYPKPLRPDNLVKEFTKKIEQQICPFLYLKGVSSVPDVKILHSEDYSLFSKDPKSLLIVVNLQFLGTDNSDQLLISRFFYRSDKTFNDAEDLLYRSYSDVINISKSEQEIAAQLDKFSTYSLGIWAEPQ